MNLAQTQTLPLVGALFLTHAPLADALLEVLAHVLGEAPPLCRAFSVYPDDEIETLANEVGQAIGSLNAGSGVLIFTDICGATPYQIATKLVLSHQVTLVCGVSVPMLVRAFSHRNEGLAVMVAKALSGAREGIFCADGEALTKG